MPDENRNTKIILNFASNKLVTKSAKRIYSNQNRNKNSNNKIKNATRAKNIKKFQKILSAGKFQPAGAGFKISSAAPLRKFAFAKPAQHKQLPVQSRPQLEQKPAFPKNDWSEAFKLAGVLTKRQEQQKKLNALCNNNSITNQTRSEISVAYSQQFHVKMHDKTLDPVLKDEVDDKLMRVEASNLLKASGSELDQGSVFPRQELPD